MNLRHLFDFSLAGRRKEVGLEWKGREYTFEEIDARSNRMAHALRARGLNRESRICVYLPNRIELIDLYLAAVKLGAIFVPINILYREREISQILADAEPHLFVTEAELDALNQEALAQSSGMEHAPIDGDAPAAMVYTSGTTGRSKGAILTHNNFAVNAVNLCACWQITQADRFLLALPLFHVHALANGLHCWLLSGCRMRLLERFEHEKAASEFLDFRPTLFFGVPAIYVRLLATPPDHARKIGGVMRLFVSGSAPLPALVFEEFRALFGQTILERYGMTETLMNLSNPYGGERRPGSVGFPLPGVSARIVEPASGADVREGQIGELYLKGSNIFAGYWRREEATREAIVDGWFHTGDLAARSPDGYITLCGRRSDLIISGGFNIYPREIEEFLMEQPEVAEAAVAPEPDRIRGEVPVAYVVLRQPTDARILEERCRAKLASFKIPRRFIEVEKLPRNALGKVQKHLLKADA